jgi:hypothetical protein
MAASSIVLSKPNIVAYVTLYAGGKVRMRCAIIKLIKLFSIPTVRKNTSMALPATTPGNIQGDRKTVFNHSFPLNSLLLITYDAAIDISAVKHVVIRAITMLNLRPVRNNSYWKKNSYHLIEIPGGGKSPA